MINLLSREYRNLLSAIKKIDWQIFIVLITTTLLLTVSFYLTKSNLLLSLVQNSFNEFSHPELAGYLMWFISDIIIILILPLIIIRFLLKKKLSCFGLGPGDFKRGIRYSASLSIIMVIIVWFISSSEIFADFYPTLKESSSNWNVFIVFELCLFAYMVSWEFIWRGYLLFGLEEKLGVNTILFQTIPFVILHFGKPFPETIGAIFGGIVLGYIALSTRSIYYGVMIHFSVMFSIDIFSILRLKSGEFGVGFVSFYKVISALFL